MTPTPLESLLSNLGLIATDIFGWVGDVVTAIVGSPLLLLTVGFLVVGGSIGIFGRLLSRN